MMRSSIINSLVQVSVAVSVLFGCVREPRDSSASAQGTGALAADVARCAATETSIPGARYRTQLDTDGEFVRVSPYCLDRFEYSVAAYRECVERHACTPVIETPVCRGDDLANRAGDMPMTCVTWNQAVRACEFVGKRLPTGIEWELAARGPDRRTYPWGADAGLLAGAHLGTNCDVPGCLEGPSPVGSHPGDRGPFGNYDLLGNVSEWTSEPATRLFDGFGSFANDNTPTGKRRVFGASWATEQPTPVTIVGTTVSGLSFLPTERFPDLGFRCAR